MTAFTSIVLKLDLNIGKFIIKTLNNLATNTTNN
jgi:hypothetical protein